MFERNYKYKIEPSGNNTFFVLTNVATERFEKNTVMFESYKRSECIDYIFERTERFSTNSWRYYIIPDLKTWATNSPNRTSIEYYDNFEDMHKRYTELRECEYNYEQKDLTRYNEPYSHLTIGLSSTDNRRDVDVLHVRAGENFLVDDFTRMNNINSDKRALECIKKITDTIGFDSVQPFRHENGRYVECEVMSFADWYNDNDCFFDSEPEEITADEELEL